MSGPITPVPFQLASSETHARGTGPSVEGFVATGARLHTTYGAFPGETPCDAPAEWTIATGTHQLWRGASSTETWSGPVASGAEESANGLPECSRGARRSEAALRRESGGALHESRRN